MAANDLIVKTRKIETWLSGDAGRRVYKGAPAGFQQTRATQLAIAFMKANPRVLSCTESSILQSISEASTLGLAINGALGEGYLIPYGNECTFQIGYKGIIALARRFQDIIITTRCVYKGDFFDYDMGDVEFIKHKRGDQQDFPDSDVTHVYMIARRAGDGQIIYRSVWTRGQVQSHAKRYSKAINKKDSPWNTAWSAMARKTLIREAFNRGELPISTEWQMALANEEYRDQGLDPNSGRPMEFASNVDDEKSATDKVAAMLIGNNVQDAEVVEPEPEPEPASKEPPKQEEKPKRTRRKKAVKKAEPKPKPEPEPLPEIENYDDYDDDEPDFEEQADNLF